jgi:hypothetical protein
MPALVAAALIIQDWKTKTPGWESIDTVRIAGVAVGWKPWQVIDVLGKPDYKDGDMAGGKLVLASFWRKGVTIWFKYGVVESVAEDEPHAETNILGFGSTPKEIEQLYGKPALVSEFDVKDSRLKEWKYRNGASFHFRNNAPFSVEVSKDTWDELQLPDWGIIVRDTQGTSSESRTTGAITGTRVKGIIRNNRDVRVRVKLRIRWSYSPSGTLADVYDSSEYEIDPHDTVIFTETGGSIAHSKEDIVYNVNVKSVTEL